MTVLLGFSVGCLLLTLGYTLTVFWGIRQLGKLRAVLPIRGAAAPPVSVIIPARNEAQTVVPALESVLALEYPNLEIIVVDDRSTDETAAVLSRVQQRHPTLKVLKVTELPAGWLGKAHALHFGALQARGDYLLFTDADIHFEKSTLARAMAFMIDGGLDQLSLLFRNTSPGGLLNTMVIEGFFGLLFLFAPWRAKNPASRRYMGVGAFNLVRATAYRAVGGHGRIALHPIDDVMLGKILKQQGFRQDCLIGYEFVQVRWYASVAELIQGVMKNVFALYRFRVMNALLALIFILCFQILPVWAIFWTTGAARGFFAATIVIRWLSVAIGMIDVGLSPRHAVWTLVSPYLSAYITLKAVIDTYRNRGIIWRGTHYALDELIRGSRI